MTKQEKINKIMDKLPLKDLTTDKFGGGKTEVEADIPTMEIYGYSTDLRSRTQGRSNYSMFFEKYEQVPKSVQEKVLAAKAK